MTELLKMLVILLYMFIILAIFIAIMFLLFVSVNYFLLYVFDIIFGNWLFERLSEENKHFRFNLITKRVEKLKERLKPKSYYIRYETPLLTICFSLTTIVFLAAFIGHGDCIGISVASIVYVVAYLIGMKRKYEDKEEFIRVLDANLEFLKLSFVPLVFLITVVGFIFTFMGTFVGTEKSEEFLGTFIKYCNEVNISDLFKLPNIQDVSIVSVVDSIFLFIQISIMFYVCSIPLQLFTYYIILVIKYFFQFGKPYKDILRVYWEKVKESIII